MKVTFFNENNIVAVNNSNENINNVEIKKDQFYLMKIEKGRQKLMVWVDVQK